MQRQGGAPGAWLRVVYVTRTMDEAHKSNQWHETPGIIIQMTCDNGYGYNTDSMSLLAEPGHWDQVRAATLHRMAPRTVPCTGLDVVHAAPCLQPTKDTHHLRTMEHDRAMCINV